MVYPPPPVKINIADKDEDGIPDASDECPEVYGEKAFNGCPNKNAAIIPFDDQSSGLSTAGYKVLDSVINVLKQHATITVSIEGHAYKTEGANSLCDQLSQQRTAIVSNYLQSRFIAASRIESTRSFGNKHPVNAGKNPREILLNSRTEIIMISH